MKLVLFLLLLLCGHGTSMTEYAGSGICVWPSAWACCTEKWQLRSLHLYHYPVVSLNTIPTHADIHTDNCASNTTRNLYILPLYSLAWKKKYNRRTPLFRLFLSGLGYET